MQHLPQATGALLPNVDIATGTSRTGHSATAPGARRPRFSYWADRFG
jgi:hypothetical protein